MKADEQDQRPVSECLGYEEDAWCRHDYSDDDCQAIRDWLKTHPCKTCDSGNPLADEEDAWTH